MESSSMINSTNFEAICRTCLREGNGDMKSIFHDDLVNVPYYHMISTCSSTKVSFFQYYRIMAHLLVFFFL